MLLSDSRYFVLSPPSPSAIYLVPLTYRRELHSTSRPLMDDEWSKGCECTESALLPSPFVPPPPASHRLTIEKEIDASVSPRGNTLSASQCIPSRPVYGAAMMESMPGRSCTFRPAYKLVIFYEFYIARRARQESPDSTGGRRRLIVREDVATCRTNIISFLFFFLSEEHSVDVYCGELFLSLF